MTLSRREVRDLLSRHRIVPSRARGQNFVVDPNTVRRVVRLAGVAAGDRVVEVGAGLGSLTLALAESGASVVAVEVDKRLLPVLREVVEPSGVTVVEADAMTLDWVELLGSESWVLVANLPYNIGTPLIADLLDGVLAIERMLVMVQREVGERLVATPGSSAYGALSVKVAYWATARLVGRVGATVFYPPPKVESVLVSLERRESPAVADVEGDWFFELVRAGFAHRRQMLRRALGGLVSAEDFTAAGIRPEARAEELDVDAWGRLARCTSRPTPS
ncbi:MAG TPA: 16S rRNA (adenine(1518)-N(6)/adenine(1519)-N(6))-dimethyltransferase RsmA [Acidimicrobiales bacterium]|nr:16S rRNA (adenine(1518)-N(6)/adenine(1519)-N(6))-dimethyltransferase RsmA [Acidimicrobiales bacterium]